MNTAATSTVAPPRMPLGRVLIWGAFALVLILIFRPRGLLGARET